MRMSKRKIATDPAIPMKPQRRKFSSESKDRILQELEDSEEHGGVSAVMAREGTDVLKMCSRLKSENKRLRLHNQQLRHEFEKSQAMINLLKVLVRRFQFVMPSGVT